jgi:hypothetical protein
MENQLSASARRQLDRFCRQYLQLQLELDYPDEAHLRNDALQQSLYARVFKDDAIPHMPPRLYQLRVLKELTKRIEHSIQDWDEEVCNPYESSVFAGCNFPSLTCSMLSGNL